MYKTNIKIAVERLKHFKVPGTEEYEESKLEAMGNEFEMVLEVNSPKLQN